ncbi:proclotting enzyme-like [Onthophagus taurus]|uniref:proclotting enzyme-like n=1 Tax=Onthophagus taurus TaxID=166361 RepID=UPI0039BEBAA4
MSSPSTHILFILFLINLSLKTSSQLDREINTPCSLANGDLGVCKRADLCASAKEILLKKKKPNICSFDKNLPFIPIVCCVLGDDLPFDPNLLTVFNQSVFDNLKESDLISSSSGGINPFTEKLINEKNKNKKSVQKCGEYSNKLYLYPPITPITTITTTTTTTTVPTTLTPSTDEETATSQIFVVNGENSQAKEFPHVALLGYGDSNDTQYLCGGALISENFILTAAHCLSSPEYNKFLPVNIVRLGDLHIKSDDDDAFPRQYGVAETYQHPEYEFDKKYHDVGLIRLNSSVNFNIYIKPACLYTEKELLNDQFIAAGWGQTSFGGNTASILQEVNLTISDHAKCSKTYTRRVNGLNNGLIEDIQICAEGAEILVKAIQEHRYNILNEMIIVYTG